MRIDRIGFKGKAVVVLGAGATRGAEFVPRLAGALPPLDSDFFTQAQRLSKDKPKKLLSGLIKQTTDTFGRNFALSMEGFFTMVEQLSNVNEDYKGRGRPPANEYKQMHDQFLQVLAAVLDETVTREPTCSYHSRLVQAMSREDTILSFNYDWLIDHTLKTHGRSKWNPKMGYGVPVYRKGKVGKGTEFWAYHEKTTLAPQYPQGTITLLKMHGSMNWFPVPTTVRRGKEVVSKLRLRERWWHQQGKLKFEIAPPEWNKPIRSGVYRLVWRRARHVLKQTRAIVFIGYSLPETDMPARALFMVDQKAPLLDLLVTVTPDQLARRRIRQTLMHRIDGNTRVLSFDTFQEFARFLGHNGETRSVPPCLDPRASPNLTKLCPVAKALPED